MYVRGVELIFFSSGGWESWDVQRRLVIPDGMPVLVDDDLAFEDASGPRPATVVNRWLRELPSSGCPAPSSWDSYARVRRSWPGLDPRSGLCSPIVPRRHRPASDLVPGGAGCESRRVTEQHEDQGREPADTPDRQWMTRRVGGIGTARVNVISLTASELWRGCG